MLIPFPLTIQCGIEHRAADSLREDLRCREQGCWGLGRMLSTERKALVAVKEAEAIILEGKSAIKVCEGVSNCFVVVSAEAAKRAQDAFKGTGLALEMKFLADALGKL